MYTLTLTIKMRYYVYLKGCLIQWLVLKCIKNNIKFNHFLKFRYDVIGFSFYLAYAIIALNIS